MVVTTYRIPYTYGETIQIKPIADVHAGNKHCDIAAFKAWLAEGNGNRYFLGIGDLTDSIVVPDKRYAKSADATEGDSIIDEQVESMADLLGSYKEHIIGLGLGNHEEIIIRRCGTNPVKRLCERLGCDYLAYSGLIRLILSENGSRGRTITIRYHHGWGGGSRTQGADLTKYSKDIAYWDADLFLYGHVHRRQSDRIPRLGLAGDKLISRPKLIGICGTFLKTYSQGEDTTYSERAGYPPVEIGGLTVNIKPTRNWVKMWIDL